MRTGGTERYCIGCGYRLYKTIGEFCPECGRGFSMCDSASWTAGPWRGRLMRMLMGPPRRADLLLTLVAMSATLMAYATPGRFDGLTWVAVALWMLCVIVWVLRLEWRRYHGARQAHVTTRDEFRRSMAAMPALLLLTIALIWVGIPVRIGFLISRAGLENAVNMIGANALRRDQAVRAGLYRVRLLDDPQSPSVSFGVEGDVAMSEKRFVYVPDAEIAAGRTANWVRRRHLRLSTNWFVSAPP